MSALIDKKGGVYFVYGCGGTGKTYLWKTLSASIRSKGEVVLNVASSGIASLLLEGGRTTHSRFLIPINLTEDSICPVKRNTDAYELLKKTSLIIWDEAPMIHKHAFEALDRTLNDVMNGYSANTSRAVFGGKVVVFGGDFRQILHVVTNGTRSECVNACINSSYIWSKCKVLKLTKNMRLTVGCRSSDIQNITDFADWLLDIGQGNVGGLNTGEAVIDIPDDLLILNSVDPMGDRNKDRALLAPLNEVVQEINERTLDLFLGEEVEYLSSDSLAESEDIYEDFDPQLYPPDLLNDLKMPGMPNHRLALKVGVLIMLLRNINHKKEALPYENVREWFFYPYQNKVVVWFENGEYKNFKPKQLLLCDDLVMLRELDVLKLANARKELAHLELEAEVSSKVKWLEECSNYESDYEDFPDNFESDDEH
ncbi:uncharacterized protein LOC143590356 [Bidens hawaiensis]|uniref:uncharacterized protein LOC143590356 n=1 Tax=Bidens hawaiensis TaxID=980011 RepID=UPI0040496868